MGSARDLVNQFYELSNSPQAGLADMRPLIAADIAFTGPLNHASGAAEYRAILEQLLPAHQGYRMHQQFESGDQVCSIYDLLLTAPGGQTIAVPMVDWIVVRDGQVAAQTLFYDPRAFMQAFGI
jgi:hypothetical protein